MTGKVPERIVLGLAALTLISVGAGSTLAPVSFYASYGIDAGASPELASELRGMGLVLFLLGLVVASGAVWRTWTFPAAVVAAVVLAGYALGRTISALVDGTPVASVVAAGVVELVLGGASIWVAVRTRPRG